jgi:hypothetical protein
VAVSPLASTAVADNSLPGLGREAMRRLGVVGESARQTIQDVSRAAALRWLSRRGPRGFTHQELGRLVTAFSSTTAASELLGRSQIRLQATDYAHFSDDREPLVYERFDSAIPTFTPYEALMYFLRLVPQLGIDPQLFGPRVERHAFTLAVATERTLVERVQRALAESIAGIRVDDPQGRGSQPLTPTERVMQAMDAAGVSPRNPQYAEMAVRTNVLDSYHTGLDRELAQPEMQEAFPVWQYLGVRDGREGEDHRSKFGRYYPASASFNAVRGKRVWNCRCSKKVLTAKAWERAMSAGTQLEIAW